MNIFEEFYNILRGDKPIWEKGLYLLLAAAGCLLGWNAGGLFFNLF